MDKRPQQTFFQRRLTLANKYMEKCSISLIIREMQIKITMRYHLTLVRIAITKVTTDVGGDVAEREPLYTFGRNVNLYSHYGKQYGCFSKN